MEKVMSYEEAFQVAEQVSPVPAVAHQALQTLKRYILVREVLPGDSEVAKSNSPTDNEDLNRIVGKCHFAAAGGWGKLSTGEKLVTALILNRAEWLTEMHYTFVEAIERIGPEWMALVPQAAALYELHCSAEDTRSDR